MTLGEIIEFLEQQPPEKVVPVGFCNPHSYRGVYEYLAFEPTCGTTVGEMLDEARSALGKTYSGYKGGEYTMDGYTDCWLAEYGCCGETIGPLLLGYMCGKHTTDEENLT